MYFVAVSNQNIEQEQTEKGQHCSFPAFWGCCMPCPQAPLPASWAIWQNNADKALSATQLCKSACVSLAPCAVLYLDSFSLKTVPPTPGQDLLPSAPSRRQPVWQKEMASRWLPLQSLEKYFREMACKKVRTWGELWGERKHKGKKEETDYEK